MNFFNEKDHSEDFNKIHKRLDDIEKQLNEIQQGIHRQDVHNNFITKVYFMIRNPMIKLITYFDTTQKFNLIEKEINTIQNTPTF